MATPQTLMMSGAWPPPAPSVWKAWMVRPLKAAIVFSTKPDSFERVGVDHHLHVHLVGDREAAVDRGRRRAPVLVQLERAGAGPDLLDQAVGQRGIALAGEAEVDRPGLRRLQHPADVPGAGRAGGGVGAGRRAGAAAEHRGDAAVERLVDLLRADEVDVAVDAAGGDDLALAGDRLGAGPMTMSTPGWVSGLPALPMAAMRPSLMPMSALTMPQWSRISALVITVSTAPWRRGSPATGPCRRGSPCRRRT